MFRFFLLVAAALTAWVAGAFEIKNTDVGGVRMTQVDSPYFSITVNPLGGRFWSIYSKPLKAELVDPSQEGSGTENVWNVGKSRFFLRGKPFTVSAEKFPDRAVVTSVGNHQGGGINFLRVKKSYTLWKDAAKITIDYDLENIADAMSPLAYGFWFHHMIGEHKVKNDFFYPTTHGIVRITPDKRPTDTWQFRGSRGWLGSADPKTGRGAAITMAYPRLKVLYTWFQGCNVPTTEWRFEMVTIDAGHSFRTRAEVLPFTGLKKISGAGGGLVGELRGADVETEKTSVPVEARVHNASAGTVEAEVMVRQAPKGAWQSRGTQTLVFDAPATVKSFPFTVKGPDETLQEIEVILRSGKKELARLNGFVNFGGAEEKWAVSPLEEKLLDERSRVELLGFNHVNSTPHIPWAKPLPGGKIKTLVLTQNDSILEVGEMAQRLDMDFTVPYLYATGRHKSLSPMYRLGDYFGMLSVSDIDANLKRAMGKKHDLIIIAGLPWGYFNAAQQKAITTKVKQGAGLVYIGPEKPDAFMPLKKVSGRQTVSGLPKAVKQHFATQGIPFELFEPGPVRRFAAPAAQVLAAVKGVPYLVEGRYGKGKTFFLTYPASFGRFDGQAGFTPNFKPEYADHKAPYELYYSLIAKLALAATGRTPALTFEPRFTPEGIMLKVDSPDARQVTVTAAVRDRFMAERASQTSQLTLKKGSGEFRIAPALKLHAGPQLLDVIVRDKKSGAVLNWGSWSASTPAPARIAGIVLDRKAYDAGEKVNYLVSCKGTFPGVTVKALLIDSFGRAFPAKAVPAAEAVKGEMKIDDRLCSRFNTLRVTLHFNGEEIDRRETSFIVRPADKARTQQGFEVGTWLSGDGPRAHLWPLYAGFLHKYGIDTVIANWGTMQTTFPIRHNLNPTRLNHLGITRCAEPLEYAKTGNKRLLVRKPCLSDPAFLEKNRAEFEKLGKADRVYGLRFYWMGDEQSITGYGGTPTDFCFSEHCLKLFREFLKKKYGTLDRLNREWNSSFTAWEKVLPLTKDEVWKNGEKSVAGWADHLEFMDSRLEDVARIMFKTLRKNDPGAKTSMSGTQPATAYGGMDWSRLMKHFDGLMNYALGGQFEIQRSLRPGAELMPWQFGYAGRGSSYSIWHALFTGMRGAFGFAWPSLCNPDGTPARQLKAVQRPFGIIKAGAGDHWINNLRERPRTAILYSQSSIRAAFIEKRHRSRNTSFDKFNLLLRHCGYNFTYITSEQLEAGVLLKGDWKNLILPDSGAMSDKEVEMVKAFVKKGGCVYAEGIPARRYANCRLRSTPALAEIFKVKGNVLKEKPSYVYLEALSFPEKPENNRILTGEQQELRRALGANDAPRLTSEGKILPETEIFTRFDPQGNLYAGIITPVAKQRPLKIELGRKAYVYDMMTHRSYGCVSTVEVPVFCDTMPLLLAVLKEPPAFLKAEVKDGTVSVKFKPAEWTTTVNIRLFAPDGKEVCHYGKRLLVSGGKGSWEIPFAPSDASGEWKLQVTDVVTGQSRTVSFER